MNEIVVVGASLAGAATARALRDAGYAGGLEAIGRCGLTRLPLRVICCRR